MNLVALHGNIGSAKDFAFLPESQAIDLWQYSHLSLTEAAKRIDLETASGGEPRGVVGYSMGGRLALHLLVNNPQGWDFAVIISAHPGLTSETQRSQRLEIDKQWAEMIRANEWHAFLEKWNNQSVLRNSSVSSRQLNLEPRRYAIAQAFENWSLGNQTDLSRQLDCYKMPLVWVVGELDEKFTNLAKTTASMLGNQQVEVIPNCGHRLLLDAARQINQVIDGCRPNSRTESQI